MWVTLLDHTPIFEWFTTRFVVKNDTDKNLCYNEIGLCAQKILTIMVSIDNKIGRTYVIV
jgi:hypothetical protein